MAHVGVVQPSVLSGVELSDVLLAVIAGGQRYFLRDELEYGLRQVSKQEPHLGDLFEFLPGGQTIFSVRLSSMYKSGELESYWDVRGPSAELFMPVEQEAKALERLRRDYSDEKGQALQEMSRMVWEETRSFSLPMGVQGSRVLRSIYGR